MLGNSVVFHGTFPAIRRKREGIHRGASQVVQETSPDSMHSSRKPRRKAINLEALRIVCVTASIKSRLQFSFNLHAKSLLYYKRAVFAYRKTDECRNHRHGWLLEVYHSQTIPLWFLKLSHLATLTCRGKSGAKTRDSERRERFFGHRYPCVPRLPKIHGEVPKKDKHFQNEVVRWQNFIFPSFFALYRYTCFCIIYFFLLTWNY